MDVATKAGDEKLIFMWFKNSRITSYLRAQYFYVRTYIYGMWITFSGSINW